VSVSVVVEPQRTSSNVAEHSALAAGCWGLVELVPVGTSAVVFVATMPEIGVGRLNLILSGEGDVIATSRYEGGLLAIAGS
jgi:hypothetical protein